MTAVLATLFPDGELTVLTVVVIVAALVAIAASSVRIGGQCGAQWLAIYLKYLARRKGKNADTATPVRALEPDLTIHTHVDRAGNRVGVATIGEEEGYSVTIRLAPTVHPDPDRLLLVLHKAFERTDIPLAAAQLVVWSVPAASVSPNPISVYWLAVRYQREDAPWAALARGDGRDGAFKAASSAALRLVSDLAELGYDASVLDTLDLHNELVVSVGAGQDSLFAKTVGYEAAETWRYWRIGDQRQACLLTRSPGDVAAVIGRCAPRSMFTCVAYTLRRNAQGEPKPAATVRIGLHRGRSGVDAEQLAALGVPLVPANGRHAEHVRATLPVAIS
ncbi:type VII secretion protein EccE [Labedaea rhizosphaerae]|uniref:Type VII secretion protein EccE n=1 Tax=Labedaea rhizosphaerae TaxID=598644 RepID=A0A4R6S5H1_LABRH|nr:type VII secretion protein EccE [Labedaea rhizosphaerae]TDP95059.1 type VII secretion protein EccE [Labedaea rhizosphaerae]